MSESLLKQHQALLIGNWIADLSNTSAFIFHELKDLNWVGFYLFNNNKLILGPFQGKPACTIIDMGRGVCGTAAQNQKPLIVPNVHEFSDHIVCDHASNSEIVLPMLHKNTLLGVFDLDSPMLNRFNDQDQVFLQKIIDQLIHKNYS